jgi:hypothetical protein
VSGDGFDDVILGAYNHAAGGKAYVHDLYRYIVSAPNGGETWPVGSTQTVSWLGRDLADLWLSVDGGLTYDLLETGIGGEPSNDQLILVPHSPTKFARLRLTPTDTNLNGRDHSDSLFTIETSIALLAFSVSPLPTSGAELSWSTNPTVGPEGIAGYRLYRSDAAAPARDAGVQIGPSMITGTSYFDAAGSQGNRYRLTAVNGLGLELELGNATLAASSPLSAWPLPYRSGTLNVNFTAIGGFGGVSGKTSFALYDIRGRHIRTLAEGSYSTGYQTATWNGRDAAGQRVDAGIYFLRLTTAGSARQVKIAVVP